MKFSFLFKIVIIIIVVLIVVWASIVAIDYFRARHQQEPLFVVETDFCTDGGTTVKYGIGYKVIHYNSTETDMVRTDTVFKLGW